MVRKNSDMGVGRGCRCRRDGGRFWVIVMHDAAGAACLTGELLVDSHS